MYVLTTHRGGVSAVLVDGDAGGGCAVRIDRDVGSGVVHSEAHTWVH